MKAVNTKIKALQDYKKIFLCLSNCAKERQTNYSGLIENQRTDQLCAECNNNCSCCLLVDYWNSFDFDIEGGYFSGCLRTKNPYSKAYIGKPSAKQFRDCCLSLTAACDQRIKELKNE